MEVTIAWENGWTPCGSRSPTVLQSHEDAVSVFLAHHVSGDVLCRSKFLNLSFKRPCTDYSSSNMAMQGWLCAMRGVASCNEGAFPLRCQHGLVQFSHHLA